MQSCALCDEHCDQPGRFCTRCVGRRGATSTAPLRLGHAHTRSLTVLQWPISALLLGVTAIAGMRTSAEAVDLAHALHKTPPVDFEHLARLQQHLVVAGALLIAAIGGLWLVWWAVAYANLRPLGVSTSHGRVWAVVAWLTPLADLVVPQRVADELWRGSDPWTPLGWRQARYGRRCGIVRLWWAAWCAAVATLGGADAALRFGRPLLTTHTAAAVDGCLIASAVLTAVSGMAAIRLVTGVTARQGERARLMIDAGLV